MIVDRKTGEKKEVVVSGSQKFLYNKLFGRILLKLFTRRFISKCGGAFLKTRISKKKIPDFIKAGNINVDDYYVDNVKSYNDFFIRKIKEDRRKIDMEPKHLIAPCDSKLQAFKISSDSIFEIKDSYYKVSDLIKNEELAKEYENGYLLIFRLTVDDYHRYSYPDSGSKGKNIKIKGILHTVNPIALEHYNFYKTNSREYTILNCDNLGKVIMVEVGAVMVGKIRNHHQEYSFKRGEEKGYFEFGGSTIVLILKDNVVIDEDILANTSNGDETRVLLGEKIGVIK